MKKQLIRICGMLIIAVSVILMSNRMIGILPFLIIWVVGWYVYDLNIKFD